MYYTTQLRPYFSRPVTYLQSLQAIHLLLLAVPILIVFALLWAIRKPQGCCGHSPLAADLAGRRGDGWRNLCAVFPPAGCRSGGAGCIFGPDIHNPVSHAIRDCPCACWLCARCLAVVLARAGADSHDHRVRCSCSSTSCGYSRRHFWLSRRFVDVILPAALLFVAAAVLLPLSRLCRSRGRHVRRWWLRERSRDW